MTTRGAARVLAAATLLLVAAAADAATWRVPRDFPTLQAAVDSPAVAGGDTILVLPGRRAGATVTKAVTIRAVGRVVVDSGPAVTAYGQAGFLFPGGGQGSGATILGFRFEGVAFPVFARGADDVTVAGNTLVRPVQGVSSWGGDGWDISHNLVLDLETRCGGGLGILVGDWQGGTVTGNRVDHNVIRGLVHVPDDDCGGYSAAGVSILADFRWGAAGAASIAHNRVSKNRVQLESARPDLVPAVGVELAELDAPASDPVIRDNAVVFNDLRRVETPVELVPDALADVNRIERNLTRVAGATATLDAGAGATLLREAMGAARAMPRGIVPLR